MNQYRRILRDVLQNKLVVAFAERDGKSGEYIVRMIGLDSANTAVCYWYPLDLSYGWFQDYGHGEMWDRMPSCFSSPGMTARELIKEMQAFDIKGDTRIISVRTMAD